MELPMKYNLAEASRAPNILAAETIVLTAATVSVGLRMLARTLRQVPFGGDDLAIVLGLPVAWGIAVSTFFMVHYGFGKHGKALSKQDIERFTQSLLAGEILWTIAIPLIKVSICLFYQRIFGEIKYMRHATNVIAAFSIGWGIMYAIVLGLQCQPLASLWDKSIEDYQCIEQMLFCFIGSAMNVFTDFVLVVLPLHAVWRLHMPTRTKLQILGILALGAFASGVSLARFVILLRWQKVVDPTWSYFYPYLFSTIEVHLGIVSACLPTLRPLIQHARIRAKNSKIRSAGNTNSLDPEQSCGIATSPALNQKMMTPEKYSLEVVVSETSENSVH